MSYTDSYEFKRSSESQSLYDDFNVYMRKDYNYINDTNSSVYSQNSMSLVTFDLSSIFNSARWTDTNDLVLVIPTVTIGAYAANNGVPVAPVTLGVSGGSPVGLVTPKNNNMNLIHQIDVQVNGKSINQSQSFTNMLKNFELISTMSKSDLELFGPNYGMASCGLDNPNSIRFNPDVNGVGNGRVLANFGNGVGYTNNAPYGAGGGAGFSASDTQMCSGGPQNYRCGNSALAERINGYLDTTTYNIDSKLSSGQRIGGVLLTGAQLNEEFKPYFEIKNNCMVWYDFQYIRVGSLCDSIRKIGLCKRVDLVLRVYLNTGSLAVPITYGAGDDTFALGTCLASQTTFTNTCPFTVNFMAQSCPAAATQLAVGCFIGQFAQTSVSAGVGTTAINLASSNARSPMNSCRIMYSSIELEKKRELNYLEMNRAKTVIYRDFITNAFNGVTSGSTYSALIQSGIVNPVAVIIMPFLSNTNTATFIPPGSPPQWANPYDTCGATGFCGSLTNLQVSIGGRNMLDTTLSYTYDNFVNQVSVLEQITGKDHGFSVGLFNRKYWDMNRAYVVMIRSSDDEMNAPRNVNISFKNNCQVSLDFLVFTVYLNKFTVDVASGRVSQ
jgi:hypothetical protein